MRSCASVMYLTTCPRLSSLSMTSTWNYTIPGEQKATNVSRIVLQEIAFPYDSALIFQLRQNNGNLLDRDGLSGYSTHNAPGRRIQSPFGGGVPSGG